MNFSPDAPATVMLPDGGTGGGRFHLEGRSELLVKRIATHEAGHAICARWLGAKIELLTIKPGDGFEGRCVRRGSSLALRNPPVKPMGIIETCRGIGGPVAGENRAKIAAGLIVAQGLMVELLGGRAAEQIVFPHLPLLDAPHDLVEAEALASTCALSSAVNALVEFCHSEALAIVSENMDALEALAATLVEQGELSGDQVDMVIAAAVAHRQVAAEHERRRDWQRREGNARAFECEPIAR
jgi:hypothetical protein